MTLGAKTPTNYNQAFSAAPSVATAADNTALMKAQYRTTHPDGGRPKTGGVGLSATHRQLGDSRNLEGQYGFNNYLSQMNAKQHAFNDDGASVIKNQDVFDHDSGNKTFRIR